MAKKNKLTAKKEKRLIKLVEASRNSTEELVEAPLRIPPQAKFTLSISLPLDKAREVRNAAKANEQSLAEYLEAAVDAALASTVSNPAASERSRRESPGPELVELNSYPGLAGGALGRLISRGIVALNADRT